MTVWTSDELTRIGTAEESKIASLRRDGTLGRPRTIWVVRHGDDLYVRSVNGPTAAGDHSCCTDPAPRPASQRADNTSHRKADNRSRQANGQGTHRSLCPWGHG
ncbi:DUF2255 family protein [Carbonactinospora thermoautotrophica]|uniref:DUF2255 family protein n=1 Tax=Carbonactinospora thermoautotrophica TaxID=1469144 RepID=UPI00099EA9F2